MLRKTLTLFASMALAVLLVCGAAMVEGVEPAQAAFPGINGKIVFAETADEGSDSNIKLINPDGSRLTTLVGSPGSTWFSGPAMSSNGTRVAYTRGGDGHTEIYKINILNCAITQITNNRQFDGSPTWSPDGTRIAFVHWHRVVGVKDYDIVVKRSDGKGTLVNLTKTPNEDEFEPAWSPNGKEVAFYTVPTYDVFVLNLETGQRRNLTDDGMAHRDTNPSWSPDGTRIVFESFTVEGPPDYYEYEEIYTMDASDGSDKKLIYNAGRPGYYNEGENLSFPDWGERVQR